MKNIVKPLAQAVHSPFLLLPALLLMWSSFAAGSKVALRSLDVHQLQFYVFLFALTSFLPVLLVSHRRNRDTRRAEQSVAWLRAILCGALAFLYYFFYNTALSRLPATEASVIHYMYPVLIMLFHSVIHKLKLDTDGWISLVLGLVGMLVVVTGGNLGRFALTDWLGDLYAFAAAVCWALFSVLGQKNTGSLVKNNGIYLAVGAVLATGELLLCSRFVLPGGNTLLILIWLGCFSFALSNCVWFLTLKRMDVALVINITYLTPFACLAFIALTLNESISFGEVGGMLIVLGSLVFQRMAPFCRWNRKLR